jgi:integrase
MASITQRPNSPYWFACFTDETGRQLKRSTKLADKRQAMKMAEALEEAAVKAKRSELTRAAATKVLSEMMERIGAEGLDTCSIREHFADYRSKLESETTKAATLKRYEPIFNGFLTFLGEPRINARLASVTPQELEAYRASELKAGKSPGTATFALKVINGVFQRALRHGFILHNPVGAVEALSDTTSEERQPFSDAQVKALLSAADVEWQGMILLAYHTGIRLNDAANLTFANIDGSVLRFKASKTSHRVKRKSERVTEVAMAPDLVAYFKSRPTPIRKDTPLFPSLHGQKSGSAGGLSNAFSRIMTKAGIDREQGDEKKGKGRRFSALSFHSLRHTMISRLSNSDAPEAITKKMSGHSTDEAHRRYIHTDLAAQQKIVAKAPRLWKGVA